MQTLETLYSRRSIRSYTGEMLTDAELKEILKAAYAAPVGRAMYDTLALKVITNKDYLAKWEAHTAAVNNKPDMHPFNGAPLVILVSSVVGEKPADNVNYSNAAIVVHNMVLAATELGIGACHIWGAVRVMGSNQELIDALELPEGMVPCCAVALGHTDEKYSLREIQDNRIQTSTLD